MATMMKLLSALELADNDNNVDVIVSAGGGGGWQQ
jgi:ribosomal protein S9